MIDMYVCIYIYEWLVKTCLKQLLFYVPMSFRSHIACALEGLHTEVLAKAFGLCHCLQAVIHQGPTGQLTCWNMLKLPENDKFDLEMI